MVTASVAGGQTEVFNAKVYAAQGKGHFRQRNERQGNDSLHEYLGLYSADNDSPD